MTLRTVTKVIRHARCTELVLSCSHRRSIGGHEFREPSKSGHAALVREYDCQDGQCYDRGGAA